MTKNLLKTLFSKPGFCMGKMLIKNIFGIKTLFFVQLKPTFRCNMKCPFCQVHKYGTKLYPLNKEMTTKEIKDILKKLYDNNACVLNLTGGEPCLRKDIVEIIDFSKKTGYIVLMNTDGTLIHRFLDDKRFVNGIDSLRISIDSVKNHDKIRNTKGAYKKIIKNIKLAKKKKMDVMINSVITKENYKEMEDLCKLAQKLDCKISLTPVTSTDFTVTTKKNVVFQGIKKVQKKKFIDKVRSLKKKYKNLSNTSFYLRHLENKEEINKKCSVLDYALNILPDGTISLPCETFTKEKISIKNKNVDEVLNSKKFKKYKKLTGKFNVCKDCESRCNTFPQQILNPINLIDFIRNW